MSAISRFTLPLNRIHFPKERLSCNLSLYLVANRPSFQDEQIFLISPHRIIAIGGLDLACAEAVYRDLRNDNGIAMAGDLMASDDPCLTAQKIQTLIKAVRG